MKAAALRFDLLVAGRGLAPAVGQVGTLIELHAEKAPLKARIQNDLKELGMADRKGLIPVERIGKNGDATLLCD